MALNIRNPEAERLARKLAEIDGVSMTDAVIGALRETLRARTERETPTETARRILEKRGLSFAGNRKPVPPDAYHDLDHDLMGRER